jgi:hypothetical protein
MPPRAGWLSRATQLQGTVSPDFLGNTSARRDGQRAIKRGVTVLQSFNLAEAGRTVRAASMCSRYSGSLSLHRSSVSLVGIFGKSSTAHLSGRADLLCCPNRPLFPHACQNKPRIVLSSSKGSIGFSKISISHTRWRSSTAASNPSACPLITTSLQPY